MPPRKRTPTPTPRDGGGKFIKTEESLERDAEALRLRSRGMGLQVIADRLGYGNPGATSRALDRAVQAVIGPPARTWFEMQMATLDDLTEKAYAILDGEHPLVSDGRVVKDADGKPFTDPDMTLKAIDRLLRVLERRAKLLGLDAAIKLEASVVEVTQHDLELAEMLREAKAHIAVREQLDTQ